MPRGKPKTLAEEKAELDARIAKRVAELLKARDAATDELQALGHKDVPAGPVYRANMGILTSGAPMQPLAFHNTTGDQPPKASAATGIGGEAIEGGADLIEGLAEAAKEAARQQNAGYQRGGTLGTVTDLDIPDALRNARANLKGAV